MSSLREIKDHIGSVRSTLKITSAMKLVASAKLRKAQKAIEGLRPYESALNEILTEMLQSQSGGKDACLNAASFRPSQTDERNDSSYEPDAPRSKKIALVAIASNSSLCGGFNVNVVKKALAAVKGFEAEGFEVEMHAVGRKMAEAMRKAGYDSPADYSDLIGHPEYAKSSALSNSLSERYLTGELERVVLVYNHFVTTSKQVVVVETYLPFVNETSETAASEGDAIPSDFIVEPSAEEVVKTLMPQVLLLKFHSAILDSEAAEHAARTVAMQAATDNAQELLGDLTLEYNKSRQQKITAEILDLLGGASQ